MFNGIESQVVRLFNLEGKEIMVKKTVNNELKLPVVQTGVYILSVQSKNATYYFKLSIRD